MLNNNHISYTSCNDVDEIISPLRSFGITYFVYVRVFKDNSRICLANNLEWSQYFFDNFFKNKYSYGEVFEFKKASPLPTLWKLLLEKENKIIIDTEREFNIGNGIDLIYPSENYIETFVFATDKYNTQINNYYNNNLDLLKQAAFYFKEKAHTLIQQASKEGIIQHPINPDKNLNANNLELRKLFLENIPIQKYYFSSKKSDVYLTPREYDCLKHLLAHQSAKEIAKILGLSPRTVETHIDNIKIKLGYRNKSDLLKYRRWIIHDKER